MSFRAIVGSVIHSKSFGALESLNRGAIVFDAEGIIQRVVDLSNAEGSQVNLGDDVGEVVDYGEKTIMPGFVSILTDRMCFCVPAWK
jgi:cytosine/adenosine deaminase-related metal-dependent hydrolase